VAGFGFAKGEPVFLVGEADGHQECSEAEETDSAVAVAEVAHVVDEDFADGEDEQEEGLPADEGGTLPEADREQGGSVEHEEDGDGEGALQGGVEGDIECAGRALEEGVEFADAGEEGEEVEGDDGRASDGGPGGGGFVGVWGSVECYPDGGGEGCDSEECGGEAAVEEGGLDGWMVPERQGEEAEEAEREGSDREPAEDTVGAGCLCGAGCCGGGEAGGDPEKGYAFGQPADGDPAATGLEWDGDGEEDDSEREMHGGGYTRLREAHQAEIESSEENGEPGEEGVVVGVLKESVEGQRGEGSVGEREEDFGDGACLR